MRILSRSDFPTARQYLAYQRDTYTRVTGRDLDLQLEGRTTSTSLFKTMQETLDLARTNVASGVTADDLKLKEDLHGWNNLNEVYRAAKYERSRSRASLELQIQIPAGHSGVRVP